MGLNMEANVSGIHCQEKYNIHNPAKSLPKFSKFSSQVSCMYYTAKSNFAVQYIAVHVHPSATTLKGNQQS